MMRTLSFIVLFPCLLFSQEIEIKPAWLPFEFFVGKWQGTGDGKFGFSTVEREYRFIMGGTFLLGENRSTYEKQEKNPKGEIHDNWDLFSYDKQSKKFRLRQFHGEDITVQSAVDSLKVSKGEFEFYSEMIENFKPGWRARESYRILNDNEFVETFSLAAPGEEFQVYITSHFRRQK